MILSCLYLDVTFYLQFNSPN